MTEAGCPHTWVAAPVPAVIRDILPAASIERTHSREVCRTCGAVRWIAPAESNPINPEKDTPGAGHNARNEPNLSYSVHHHNT